MKKLTDLPEDADERPLTKSSWSFISSSALVLGVAGKSTATFALGLPTADPFLGLRRRGLLTEDMASLAGLPVGMCVACECGGKEGGGVGCQTTGREGKGGGSQRPRKRPDQGNRPHRRTTAAWPEHHPKRLSVVVGREGGKEGACPCGCKEAQE